MSLGKSRPYGILYEDDRVVFDEVVRVLVRHELSIRESCDILRKVESSLTYSKVELGLSEKLKFKEVGPGE